MSAAAGCGKAALPSAFWSQDMKGRTIGERCLHGHLLTSKTLQVTKSGHKRCRICLAMANERWKGKNSGERPSKSDSPQSPEWHGSL